MPSGSNWVKFIYVNLAFLIYIAAIFYYNQVAQVKSNWAVYRCNPAYMWMADDMEENFTYCVQSMQTNFMGYLLQPLTFVTGSLTTMMGGFSGDIQNIRAMFDKVRSFLGSTVQSIFGVFLNLVIEFQRVTISIKDLIGKTIGIMTSLMYMMDGSVKTMNSTWAGPPGQLVRSLGKCFHSQTIVELMDGRRLPIADVRVGDVLPGGSIVDAIMQIDNVRCPEIMYTSLLSPGVWVTGSHLVASGAAEEKFVRVEHHPDFAVCSTADTDPALATPDIVHCLITSDHKIRIGNHVFWDWEDHGLKLAQGTKFPLRPLL